MQLRSELTANDSDDFKEITHADDISSDDDIGEEFQNDTTETRVRYWRPVYNVWEWSDPNSNERQFLQ